MLLQSEYAAATEYENNALADAATGVVQWGAASVVDLGVSIYNSVVPESYETTTYNTLADLNSDLASFYTQNRDAVELGSFIGGMVIPGFGVARAAKMAASGSAGLFGSIGRLSGLGYSAKKVQQYSNKAAQLATTASANTAAMKSALWQQRLWTVEGALAENVLYEAAFYGLMNDHAYMDNYGLDTFLYSTALGTAFTAPIQLAINNKSVKDLTKALQLGKHKEVGTSDAYAVKGQPIADRYTPGTAMTGMWYSLDDLSSKLGQVTDPASADMRAVLQKSVGEQELAAKRMMGSMLDEETASISSAYTQVKEDVPNQKWRELRKDPGEVNTPMQIMGHFSRKNPNALAGVVKGGVSTSKDTLHNVGKTINPADPLAVGNAVHEDGFIDAMTYDEAIDFLGGANFKESDNVMHVYEWDGEVYASSAVHGRLMRGAAEAKLPLNTRYSMSKTERTYDPLSNSLAASDGEFIDALYATREVLGVHSPINELDIPRMQAMVQAGLGGKIERQLKGKKAGQTVVDDLGVDQFAERFKLAKMRWIADLNHRGFDQHYISKATNTPIDTVDATLHAGGNAQAVTALTKGKDVPWAVYKDGTEATIKKALSPTMLEVKLNPKAKNPWDKATAHDRDLLANVTKAASEAIVMKSKSQLFRDLYQETAGKATNAALEQNLWQLYATGAHGSTWTSSDMYLRSWEDLNATLITMGQDFQEIVNTKGIAQIVGNLQPLAESVASDGKAAIINLEYMKNALDAVPSGKATSHMKYDEESRRIITKKHKDPSKIEYLKIPGTTQDWVAEFDSVAQFVENGVLPAGDELWAMRKTNGKLFNTGSAAKRGVYLPYNNVTDDFVSYIVDTQNPRNIQMISGNNLDQMNEKVAKIRAQLTGTQFEIVPRNELDRVWNQINDYSALEYLKEASPDLTKSGIASGEVTGSVDFLDRMLRSYESEIVKQSRIFVRASNSTVFDTLQQLSNHHDDLARSARGTDAQKMQATPNPADLASKTLLNLSKLGYSPFFTMANNWTDIGMNLAAQTFQNASAGIKGKLRRGVDPDLSDFVEVSAELAKHNIPNPWQNLQDYIQATLPADKKQSKELVSAGSQIMTLFNLRLGDVAHGIVTTLSAPALVMGEAATMGTSPAKHFMQVARYFWNDGARLDIQQIRRTMVNKGYGARKTSEATALLNKAVASKGWLKHLSEVDSQTLRELYGTAKEEKTKGAIGDLAYKGLTRVSDWAEETTREFAYLTGYEISKSKYPQAVPAVHEEAANLFANRAMGNYASRQRPVMFQGSFGQAMGLYQTFMLTVGQNLTRMIETKNVKALGAFGGTYTGMFGLESLPLYNDVNQMVGNWLSAPDHQDITQTVYQAFGNKYGGHERTVGEFLLYGAPSALFQSAWYTRGDLDPRMPIESGRLAPPVVVAMADLASTGLATAQNAYNLVKADAPMMDVGKAMAEGVIMQTMWRPAARMAELGLGYSIDRKGEMISSPEEMRNSWHPIFARITGARPLKEAVLRQQNYYNRAYDTVDTQRRRTAVRALRTHLRGTEDSSVVGNVMQSYLRSGGSPEGWGAVLNKTYLSNSEPFATKLLSQLKTQEGIVDIVEGYAY